MTSKAVGAWRFALLAADLVAIVTIDSELGNLIQRIRTKLLMYFSACGS